MTERNTEQSTAALKQALRDYDGERLAKFVQITAANGPDDGPGEWGMLYALDQDGRVWWLNDVPGQDAIWVPLTRERRML